MTQDLTKITMPFGLLSRVDEETAKALRDCGGPYEYWSYGYGEWLDSSPQWSENVVYRKKRPPRTYWLAVDAAGHVHDAFDTAEQAHGRSGYLDCDIIKVVADE